MSHYGPTPKLTGQLTAADFPVEGSVTVVLQDGSTCRFRNAFYHREGDWVAVYTEHAGYHMFSFVTVSAIKGHVRVPDDRYVGL